MTRWNGIAPGGRTPGGRDGCSGGRQLRGNRGFSRRQRRAGFRTCAGCTLAFCVLASTAAADTVSEERGVFSDVQIIALDDGKLVFRFKDERTVERPLGNVRQVSLPAGADRAASELTRGDALRWQKKHEQAVPLYERAREITDRDWIRTYATIRLIDCYDHTSQYEKAVACYLSIVDKHPSLLHTAMPVRLPAAGSAASRRLRDALGQMDAKDRPETFRKALDLVRRSLEKGEPVREEPNALGASKLPASAHDTAGRKGPTAGAPPRRMRPTARVYELLESGRDGEALRLIEEGLRTATGDDRAAWWLAEAEYHLATRNATRAALAAIKVEAVCPNSRYYAESLFVAARAYETVRPAKAVTLYEDCVRQATASVELKRQAQERLAVLRQLSASRPALGG